MRQAGLDGRDAALGQQGVQFRWNQGRLVRAQVEDQVGMGLYGLRAPVAALRLGRHPAFPLEALLAANGAAGLTLDRSTA